MTTQSSERESLTYLPGYVGERNAQAIDAGLAIEKQTRRQGVLSTWYSGTEAQMRKARLVRIPQSFAFPAKVGGRRLFSLPVFCPAAPCAELKCTLVKMGEDRYRLAIVNEVMPVSWRALGGKVSVYKYCDLREGANSGPATVYLGPLAALRAAGIAPPEAEHQLHRSAAEQRSCLWQSHPVVGGRHRFVVYHEAEARAHAQDEERGRSNFKSAEQYQDWLLEVVAASIGMIRRQLRVKTRGRYIYTVTPRTLKELEAHFTRLRRTIARTEILAEKEDVRAEELRAELRRAALAAMRDASFQRFLGKAVAARPPRKR
ncbi:MAG TPA: hypothetical protein VD867_00980 [Burkholderiales bacterium]|nr:hypothetical protein [Burkholderiales bacterium]